MITEINGNHAALEAAKNSAGHIAPDSPVRDLSFADQYESRLDDMGLLEAYRTGDHAAVIKLIRAHSNRAEETLRTLAEAYIKAQGKMTISENNAVLTWESQTMRAEELISEDGPLGVKAVSDRIAGFAIAFTGGDPDKLPELKAAIEKGFRQAAKMFGGELPDICNQTYDEVMRKLDEWEAGVRSEPAAEQDT